MRWIYLFLFIPPILFAQPKGANVASGTAEVSSDGSTLQIQTSDRAVIDWDEFSIGEAETTHFIQPSTNSAVLNRVGNGVSNIDGLLKANGRVYIVNPNGVVIGKNGQIKTAAFYAATLELKEQDFLLGQELTFEGSSKGTIINQGTIEAIGGDVFLFAKTVVNEGTIQALDGEVGLVAAEQVFLKPSGLKRVYISPSFDQDLVEEGVVNQGLIEASKVALRADGNVYRLAINQGGTIEALSTKEEGGRVFLVADGGLNQVSGSINAKGGSVCCFGEEVAIQEGAKIDVSSDRGGGEVLIGGDFQGMNPTLQNAKLSHIDEGAKVLANATVEGDGGKVIVWSDGAAVMKGKVSVCGGPEGGDGGFIEVSAMTGPLVCSGEVKADAPLGKGGTLLLDPSDITIDNSAATGDCPPTNPGTAAPMVTISSADMATCLGTIDLVITTNSGFNQPGDITITDGFTWSTSRSLTLIADNDINFIGAEGIENLSGGGDITIQAQNDIIFDFEQLATGSGTLALTCGNDIKIGTLGNQNGIVALQSDTGEIILNSGNDVIMGDSTGGVGSYLLSIVSTGEKGSINITSGRDLHMTATNHQNSGILTGALGNTFEIGRNLILEPGSSGSTVGVYIGGLGTSNTKDMEFKVGGDVRLKGGDINSAYALIGNFPLIFPYENGGNILFNSIGGSVELAGGMGAESIAQIGHMNLGSLGATNYIATGDVTLASVGGEVILTANTGAARIGHGTNTINGPDTYIGNVTVNALGNVSVIANDAVAAIGPLSGGAGTSTIKADTVSVNGRNISIQGGAGEDAMIGYFAPGPVANIDIETVSVTAFEDIILTPSSGGDAVIGVFGSNILASSNLKVEVEAGRDFIMNGGMNFKQSLITAEDIADTAPFEVSILADYILIGNGLGDPGSAIISALGEIEAIANVDLIMEAEGEIFSEQGAVTLVVDNAFPNPDDIGNGRFIMKPGSAVTAKDGSLRIFTARRENNSIEGPLNLGTFDPGPVLINSDAEQWGVYFFDDFGGFPYTIFYKDAIPAYTQSYAQIYGEPFQKLKAYDQLFFDSKCFLLRYDVGCYDLILNPNGMLSSFDLFDEEGWQTIEQTYKLSNQIR